MNSPVSDEAVTETAPELPLSSLDLGGAALVEASKLSFGNEELLRIFVAIVLVAAACPEKGMLVEPTTELPTRPVCETAALLLDDVERLKVVATEVGVDGTDRPYDFVLMLVVAIDWNNVAAVEKIIWSVVWMSVVRCTKPGVVSIGVDVATAVD